MKKTLLFLILIFFFLPSFLVVEAANLSFDKSSYSVGIGQTIQVQINIDTGGEAVNGTEVYINYDSSFLSIENVSAGSFFPTVTNETGTAGRIYIAAFVDDPASSKTGSGTIATITFKGIKDGMVNLSFDCNNSKIAKSDVNSTNIFQCSSDYKVSVSIGTGSNTSSSSNSSSDDQSNSSNNNQPQTLPKSGIFENLINFAIPGAILFLIGGGLKLFILK
jgi:hypothetical protein